MGEQDRYVWREYIQWLREHIGADLPPYIDYDLLLTDLASSDFKAFNPKDEMRVKDGLALREQFAEEEDYDGYLLLDDFYRPCSVLEMMVALSIKCEREIMHSLGRGDRTPEWFWGMVENMGLIDMTDDKYERSYVKSHIYRMIHHTYERDGTDGLFTVKLTRRDMRKLPIMDQMNLYLDENYYVFNG